MKPQVYIRVDGNSEIGLGHLIRCMALARNISEEFLTTFFCRFIPEALKQELASFDLNLKEIQHEEQFFSAVEKGCTVVVDGYNFDSVYQKKLADKGALIVVVDDLYQGKFNADAIINHALGVLPENYNAMPFTQLCLGTKYALLRPEFLQLQDRESEKNAGLSLLICFGGADPLNLTLRALDVAAEFPQIDEIRIVVGAAYQFREELSQKISEMSRKIQFLESLNPSEMARVMSLSTHAIVPCSGTLLEALSAKLVVISGYYADNQRQFYSGFRHAKAFADAGQFEPDNIRIALKSTLSIRRSSFQGIDSEIPGRFQRLFGSLEKQKEISLRRADHADDKLTYKWGNDPLIRRHSFTKDHIPFEEHKKWFEGKISSADCVFLIAEYQQEPVGSVRFDLNEGNVAVVSYLIDSSFHGKGLGLPVLRSAIKHLAQNFSELSAIIGYVMKENLASLVIFRKLGFNEEILSDRIKFTRNWKNEK
ncbi:MAG: UDP-2,4-diacetamido-2,4,6-trideoxy-beta-L-altropyranose hydrolase [Imperialibacter sp.]|uniref:UDP-2,4-diacetamido-2,4, 6-trideoxy-beta-L-altropyranose hydrolase n=1 Tax=Imperialibacter sp. TaxID=2038411 RepID=UPI0032EE39F1